MTAFDLRTMARRLGGVVVKQQVLCPGPGHSSEDRSLSVCLSASSPNGFVAFSHAGDDWRICRDYVCGRLGYSASPPPSEQRKPIHAPRVCNTDNTERARELWNEGRNPIGSVVETYLASRALNLAAGEAGEVVRFHPRCPWRDDAQKLIHVPAMLTVFRSIANPRLITAIQRTALTPEGTKIGRKMLGTVAESAIMLDAHDNVEMGLHIGEGFETCQAARQLGLRPCWALGSAGAIASFPVLGGIECLSILAELDDNGANARAIEAAGARWTARDREVLIISPRVGGDVNDALRSVAA